VYEQGKDMKDMGPPMHSCVSLILPIALFSGLKNLNREDAKDAKSYICHR